MEILLVVIALVVIVGVLMSALSSKNTKLFRRIWSSGKAGMHGEQTKAINELLERFDVSIPASGQTADLAMLGNNIDRLLSGVTDFDLANKNNLGVIASNILARNLDDRLQAAGISNFDEQLKMLAGANLATLARYKKKYSKPNVSSGIAGRTAQSENLNLERQIEPDLLRSEAKQSYETGWMKAKNLGKDEKSCHETALVSVLYDRFEKFFGSAPQTEGQIRGHMMEIIPFNIISAERGREAIIEYVVWREQKEMANIELITNAISEAQQKILKDEGGMDFLNKLTSGKEEDKIGWTTFLRNS